MQREINAQAAITQAFSKEAPKAVATFSGNQIAELKKDLAKETDPAKKAAISGEIDKWGEGGRYRVLLHTLAGGLSGGASGAAGAATSAGAAPLMEQLQSSIASSLQTAGLSQEAAKGIAQGITGLTAAGAGAAVGGSAGAANAFTVDVNNRQLHPSETQRIKDLAGGNPAKQARLTEAACALVRCADGVPKDDANYTYLKGLQDAGASLTEEKALLSQQQGQQGRIYGQLFQYTGVDQYIIDPATQNKLGTRLAGAVQAGAGIAGVAGSSALCTTGVGCAAGAITGTVSADYGVAGIRQAATGNAAIPYGEQVLQSLGLSPQAAALTYAVVGLAPAAVEAVALNSAVNQAAKYNSLVRASYAEFTPQGLNVTPDVLASPQVKTMLAEAAAASPTATPLQIEMRVTEWLQSGSTLPIPAIAAPGSTLIKIVPKGDAVNPYSPYWFTPEQARAIGTMTPEQAGQVLGLPATQAAKLISGGADFYAITPKSGATPQVFVSNIAPTTQGAYITTPNAQQVVVPNRTLWNSPIPIDPLTLRSPK